MQKLTIIVILISLYSISICSGQNSNDSDYVSGEVLVQLNNKSDLPIILNNYSLNQKEVISQRFNIYLLTFDNTRNSNSAIINMLAADRSIANVQNNHIISLRGSDETMPNDSLFDMQWSLHNTGQNNGVVGADIDAPLAWDFTVGGTTALGDTIVVAIIDGGTDLNHEDLNFWKNHAEIPNNNIDDDNNGYIDDYDGWNAYNNSGTIPANVHGVHVCGIAGAIGNNEIGIAGVNWNVKTLPIAGESNYESIVVKALSYIYVVRERYDQTNGAEGAFVVAQNNSFGVDNGQPANYSIWEAMYDSLGQLGILSMGATANRAWDIDEVGDVPTAFTTDYMISVTNTTNQDKLFPSAGWGKTTIDLGAPGTSILSLGLNNTYRTSSGTSMATPHVTGAAALLMAVADSSFIIKYKNNPAVGALFIKDYLLEGVEKIPDLEGKTVSEGRLNIFNSIQILNNQQAFSANRDSIYNEMSILHNVDDTLIIKNTSFDTLQYELTIPNQPNWISLSQYQGQLLARESDTIFLTFDTYNIDTGSYYCIIQIDGDNIDLKEIPVELFVYDYTGIDDILQTSSVKVFPNPTRSSVEFKLNTAIQGDIKIEIYDQYGSIVFVDNRSDSSGDFNLTWNSNSNNRGLYFYRILFNNNQVSSGKIVKL